MPDDLLTHHQRNRIIGDLAYREHPNRDRQQVSSVGAGVFGGFPFAMALIYLDVVPRDALFLPWIVCGVIVGFAYNVYKNQAYTATVQELSRNDDLSLLWLSKRKDLSLGWLSREGVDVDRLTGGNY